MPLPCWTCGVVGMRGLKLVPRVGGAGGSWRRGHRRVLNQETPMTNLYVAMLERMGIRAEKVGDSNGKLELG